MTVEFTSVVRPLVETIPPPSLHSVLGDAVAVDGGVGERELAEGRDAAPLPVSGSAARDPVAADGGADERERRSRIVTEEILERLGEDAAASERRLVARDGATSVSVSAPRVTMPPPSPLKRLRVPGLASVEDRPPVTVTPLIDTVCPRWRR